MVGTPGVQYGYDGQNKRNYKAAAVSSVWLGVGTESSSTDYAERTVPRHPLRHYTNDASDITIHDQRYGVQYNDTFYT